MDQAPEEPRVRRHRWDSQRARVALVAVVLVLIANVAVLAGVFDGQDGDDDSQGEVAAASVTTVVPPVQPELDPSAGVTLSAAPIPPEVDTGVVLPVPQDPPSNPYAPEPEIRHGRLEIPAIGLSQPLFEGVSLTAINRGPSHWPGTAMPGEIGNVVVAGHRTTYTRPFWDLQALKPGDELIFTMNDGTRHVYALDRLAIVSPTDVYIVEQRLAYTATLFACHPRGSARQRIVAHFTMKGEIQQVQLTDTYQIRAPAGA